MSHHQNDKEKVEKIAKIDQFFAEEFAYFLKRMKETPDGDKSLLDNSLLLYGCAIGDGNRHNHDHLPVLLAGHGGGKIKTGCHFHQESETPLNNLYLTMLEAAGVDVPRFGDSTDRLKSLYEITL